MHLDGKDLLLTVLKILFAICDSEEQVRIITNEKKVIKKRQKSNEEKI